MSISLLAQSAHTKFHCFDFSTRAINILKSHPAYDPSRINAFVFDLTSSTPTLSVKLSEAPPEFNEPRSALSPTLPSVDLISCIFVLSALPPERHQASVQSLISVCCNFFSSPPHSGLGLDGIYKAGSQARRHDIIPRLRPLRHCSTQISSKAVCRLHLSPRATLGRFSFL